MMPYLQHNSNYITETIVLNPSSHLSNRVITASSTLSSNDSFQVLDSTLSNKETLKWFFKTVSEADNSCKEATTENLNKLVSFYL